MNKLMIVAGAAVLAGMVTGCASTRIEEKIGTWQKERPYAEKIMAARESGRKLQDNDVELVFTIEDFKKELPNSAAAIDAVLTVAKSALNIGAEVGNTASPLYIAAVDSVDRKWAKYVGRDVETEAQGNIDKYLETVEAEYRDQVRKDWIAYQKIVSYKPDPAVLERGKKVCEKFTKTDEKGQKMLDVLGLETLQYSDKAGDKDDYNAFVTYRNNDPAIQGLYDSALKAKILALLAKLQLQMQDLLNATQKLSEDPEVKKLNFMDLAQTLKGTGVGVGKVFADPLAKLNGALNGFVLSNEIDEIIAKTQQAEQAEANKAKVD